ncbi:MAG TPA: phosphoadenylyl-sulfate reductase [Tepidisphaeraceae bacterium]|jgi:phosphoadenosine phosphosulfate reductase
MTTETAQNLDLTELNAMFETAHPSKIVEWAIANWGGDEVVATSSFGAESALMIHLAIQHKPDIRIVMIDTGYLFPETWRHMEEMRRRFNLNVWVYRTKHDPIMWLREHGEGDPTWRNDDKKCCAANKNEPMDRAMKELRPKAWLRGIRRDQAKTRELARFVEWDERHNCYAVSPLLNWSGKEIYQYMKQHELPYHPLYEKGYPSIGCNPLSCTRAIQPGEDPRAGRWAGSGKVECGINLGSLDSSQL